MSDQKSLKPLIGLTALGALAVAIGIWVGVSFKPKQEVRLPANTELGSAVAKLEEVLDNVEREYVDKTDLTKLSEATISTMLQQLDPHSTYLTAKELATSNVELQGELEGIGIEFRMLNNTVYVIAPISGGPSEKAGIKAGDKIVKVDDQPFASQKLKPIEVVEKLRGPKGTKVKLTIQRNNPDMLLDFMVKRARIPIDSVDVSYMIDRQVGYIKVRHFTPHTFKEFKTAFHTLQKQGMKKLLLDLRDNPGGYMDMAIQMADHVLDQGQLIVYTKGKKSKYSSKYHAKGKDKFANCPIIVLINEGSASASEIVAGALQDNDRALIVGRRSFGKGLVQVPTQLKDGAQLRLTVARYYTPSGRFIQKTYKDGTEDYHMDLINRYDQGEYFRVDNIQFDETLKYQTSKGRTVYGGGGIMPDYFVPLELHPTPTYLDQLITHHILQEYALEYVDRHRESMAAMNQEKYSAEFEVNELMLKKIVSQAEKAGIAYDGPSFRADKSRVKRLLKAYIARSLWGERGFYPIYHQEDQEFQKALQLFDEAEALLQEPMSQK